MTIDILSLMALPRHQRRALAKINHIKRIAGSHKPYVKKENQKATR